MAFSAAYVVFAAAPRKPLNRIAGLVLFIDGIHILTSGLVSLLVLADVRSTYGAMVLHFMLDAAAVPLYLAFIGRALDTPLARPFRDRRVIAAVSLPVAAFIALLLVNPHAGVASTFPVDHWYWTSFVAPLGPVHAVLLAAGLTFFYTLAAAVSAWRRAATPLARQQAKAYVLAFGVRDLGWGAALTTVALGVTGVIPGSLALDVIGAAFVLMGVCVAVYPPLVMYGILRNQLFDIDIKLKWTLRRGTVAASFVAVFFVASEGAQLAFEGIVGPIAGLVAAGLLVFALAPLQRAADGVADRALPHVQDTQEYRLVRKREVYRAAVESALEDGAITDKERSVLATLADQLGLSSREALDLEREARAVG